jgi:iron complex outermembrane recepter protein
VTGQLGPRTGFINAGYTQFQGLTFGIDYQVDLTELSDIGQWLNGNPGRLKFEYDMFYVNKQQTSVTGLGFDLNDDKNEIGNADLQWKIEATWVRDPWAVVWTAVYIGKSEFNNDFTIETRHPLLVDSYMVHDLAFSYDLSSLVEGIKPIDGLTARFVVKNVGDVEPPYGTTGIGVYDVIGRYYQFRLTARF